MEKPNIIMLILDAARKDMFGCYGNTEGLTPNLDKIALEGMVLKNHYAAGCGSAQAHVSIFTGQHSERHKMVHNFCDLSDQIKTLPLLLKEIGYKTYGHMVANICPPAGYRELFGFDELMAPGTASDDSKTVPAKANKGFSIRQYPKKLLKNLAYKFLSDKYQLKIGAKLYDGKKSLDYLYSVLSKEKDSGPVFAYTTLLHPHIPYLPPQKYIDRVFNGKKIDPMAFKLQKNLYAYANGDFGDPEDGLDSIRKLYKGEMLYVDHLVGEFVARLERENLLDNTILIVMSDHGEYLGEHRLITHGNQAWSELFNTPCMIRYPEKIAADSHIEFMTSGVDILPSIFGLLSQSDFLTGKTGLDGINIFGEIGNDIDQRFIVVDSPPVVLPERLKKFPDLLYKASMINRAIRTKDYKYLWQSNGEEHLFKVVDTIENEQDNIISENKEIALEYKNKMIEFYSKINPEFKIDEYPVMIGKQAAKKIENPVIREELKKLGYLE